MVCLTHCLSHTLFFPMFQDFDALEGLEGAIGGSEEFGFNDTRDLASNLKGVRRDRSKVQHLSESSNDSGFAYKNGLSSNSSAESSYAGSPAGSSHGADSHTNLSHQHSHTVRGGQAVVRNGSTSGNGTEHDPHGSRSLAQQQVAHNHTYNTPPGQVPREVRDISFCPLSCLEICLYSIKSVDKTRV